MSISPVAILLPVGVVGLLVVALRRQRGLSWRAIGLTIGLGLLLLVLGVGLLVVLARAGAEMDYLGVYQIGCCSAGYDAQTQSMQQVEMMPPKLVEDMSYYHAAIVDELAARQVFKWLGGQGCFTGQPVVCQLVDELAPWIERYSR
ncbi:MAG: hypothetical protein KA765_10915 [Thermoflexales bacterium]|nr:hypothetical protein [Thermoflexales bacterium]